MILYFPIVHKMKLFGWVGILLLSWQLANASKTETGLEACTPAGVSVAIPSDIPLGNVPDPKPVQFDPNSQDCQNWVKAVGCLCGPEAETAAKTFVDAVTYISFDRLSQEMAKEIEKFKAQIGNRHFYVIYTPGKSTQWLIQKFAHLLPVGQFEVLGKNADLHVRLKKPGAFKDVLVLDDALYSGQQIANTAGEIKRNCPDCHFHAVAPFSTVAGRAAPKEHDDSIFHTTVYSSNTIDTVEQALLKVSSKIPVAERIQTITQFYPLKNSLAHTFFQHKVPDRESVTEFFFRFRAANCKDKAGDSYIMYTPDEDQRLTQFACIPVIGPPYRNFSSSRDFAYRSPTQVKDDQNLIREMLQAYHAGQCELWRKKHPEFLFKE